MVEAVSKVTEAVDTVIVKVREGRRPDDAACDDLPAVIRGRLAFWDLLAREQDRVWIADLPDQPVAVEMSRPQAVELLDTLLGNIFAHTDPGTGFRVKVTTEGDFALLSVEDDGPGFPADPVVERGASGAGSTGLGLDIVRRAAEAAGGQMTIASRAAGGALVRVSLRRSVAAGPARFSDSLARPEAVAPMMDR
jgi:signal transduction histidine kinase